MRERLDNFDIAKAICIVLVVVGHFNPTSSPAAWGKVFDFIYSFHMPLFLFVGGYLFAYTWKDEKYFQFLKRKSRRLMVPYLFASLVIIGIKLVMQNVLPVKNEASMTDLVRMFYYPSAAIHLWFLWTLMFCFVVAAISSSPAYRWAVALFSLVIWLVPVKLPTVFCLDYTKNMMVFFSAGMVSEGLWKKEGVSWPRGIAGAVVEVVTYVLFAILEVLYLNGMRNGLLDRVLPFVGIAAVLFLSSRLGRWLPGRMKQALVYLGRSSMIVFLFHTVFSEFVKVLMKYAGITPETHFIPCLLLAVAAGLFLPLALKRYVIDRSKVLKLCFLGEKA